MSVLAPVLAIQLLGCSPEPDESPRPPLLVATLARADTLRALRPRGLWIADAFAQSPLTRPAMASLWTGLPPDEHGLTDPTLHDLAVHTVADTLRERGYTTHAHDPPLGVDEDWGFDAAGWGFGAGTLTWAHQPDAERIEAWLHAHPNGHALLTTLPDGSPEVELLWIGPDVDPGTSWTTQAAQVDIAATLLDLTGTTRANALGGGGSSEIIVVRSTAFHTGGGPLIRERIGGASNEVSHPGTLDRASPAIVSARDTNPFGTTQVGEMDTLTRAQVHLEAGRYRAADEALTRLEARSPGLVVDLLRSRWLLRKGEPLAALERLETTYGQFPEDHLALRIAHHAWDMLDAERALYWVDIVLDHRPHEPEALELKRRCLDELGRDSSDIEALVAVWGPSPTVQPEALWTEGDWLGAMELARGRLSDDHSIRTRLFLARAHLEVGEPERAVRYVGPLVRRLDHRQIRELEAEALSGVAARREYLQSLRGGWRGRP